MFAQDLLTAILIAWPLCKIEPCDFAVSCQHCCSWRS